MALYSVATNFHGSILYNVTSALHKAIGSASGFKDTLTVAGPRLFGPFSGYFDINAKGEKLTSVVAEPHSNVIILTSVGALFLIIWWRRGKRI